VKCFSVEAEVALEGVSFKTTVLELVKNSFKKYENEVIVCRVKYSSKVANILEDSIVNTGPEAEDMELEE
jgi:thymidylate kinase